MTFTSVSFPALLQFHDTRNIAKIFHQLSLLNTKNPKVNTIRNCNKLKLNLGKQNVVKKVECTVIKTLKLNKYTYIKIFVILQHNMFLTF